MFLKVAEPGTTVWALSFEGAPIAAEGEPFRGIIVRYHFPVPSMEKAVREYSLTNAPE
jgi:hypothetical protein